MIKILKKSIREFKTASILSIVFITLEVLMECVLPFITSMLIDEMEASSAKMSKIAIYAVILVVMAMLSLTFGVLSGKFSAKASAGYAKNLRKDMYENICNFSFSNIDKFSSSSLVTRMTTDVTNVQMAFMMIIRAAFRSPLMLIFSIVMSFIMAPSLAWLFLIVVPFLLIVFIVIIVLADKRFKKVFREYDDLNSSIQENISGIRVVKSYVREDYEVKKFNKSADKLATDFKKAERIIAFNSPAMQLSIFGFMFALLFIGSIIIIKNSSYDGSSFIFNKISVGQLQSLVTYGVQSLMALMMLSMVIVMITMAVESAARICEVLKEKSDLTNPENPIYEVENGDIVFDNVSFKYKEDAKKYALSNINLDIKSGQTIGILGGTGSSKTTLVNLISRLYDVTEGSVKVAGHDVREYDLETLRNQVAVVLQKNLLFSGTIFENLRWGNKDATDEEVIEAAKLACADEFVETFPDKYETHIEQGGTNVSGGQKQRLCIARALLKHPKILILDDSTSAVDTKTDAKIRKAFKEYIPDTTKIIIAQRISSIEDSDQIIILDGGSISAIGTHEELLKNNPIYQEVYYSQNKVNGGNK